MTQCFGAYCEQHGVTAIWRCRRPTPGVPHHDHETRRIPVERTAAAEAGKHGGEPSDRPWSPPPTPPSPDGSGPSGPSDGGGEKATEG